MTKYIFQNFLFIINLTEKDVTEFIKDKIIDKENSIRHEEFKPQHGWISRLIKYFEETTASDFRETLKNRADIKVFKEDLTKSEQEEWPYTCIDGNIIESWMEFIDDECSNYFRDLAYNINHFNRISRNYPDNKHYDIQNKEHQKLVKYIPDNHYASLTIKEKNMVNCLTKCKETIERKCTCLDKAGPFDKKKGFDLTDQSDMSDESDMSDDVHEIAKFTGNYDSDQFSECSKDIFMFSKNQYRFTHIDYNESYFCEKCKEVLFKRVIY